MRARRPKAPPPPNGRGRCLASREGAPSGAFHLRGRGGDRAPRRPTDAPPGATPPPPTRPPPPRPPPPPPPPPPSPPPSPPRRRTARPTRSSRRCSRRRRRRTARAPPPTPRRPTRSPKPSPREARALLACHVRDGAAAVLAERAAAERAANPRRSCSMPTATSSSSAAAAAVGPTGCPFSPTRQCSGSRAAPRLTRSTSRPPRRAVALYAPPSRCRAISRRVAGRRSQKSRRAAT